MAFLIHAVEYAMFCIQSNILKNVSGLVISQTIAFFVFIEIHAFEAWSASVCFALINSELLDNDIPHIFVIVDNP